MSNLIPFNYDGIHGVRVITDSESWFVAKDVCEILGLSDVSKSVSRLEDDEKGTKIIPTPGGNQSMLVINESGLYSLILTSNKPEAKEFKRWITHEVIPQIRKHGGYLTPSKIEEVLLNPDTIIQLATQLKNEQQRTKQLTAENKLLAQETLTWADRKVIEAIVKKIGGKIGYEAAWREFKKELLYSHSINLNSRITNWRNSTGRKSGPKTLDMIDDDELQACLSTATALARHHKVDISDIINKFEKSA
jgi:prophage antirepressor-like protein